MSSIILGPVFQSQVNRRLS